MQHARHFVDGVHIPHGDDAPLRDVGEERNFGALFLWDGPVGTTHQGIGLYTNLTQFLGSVLGGFGLQFAGCSNPRYITQVHKGGIVRAHAQAHLPHCFKKGQGLDVANGAANFNNRHIHRVRCSHTCTAFDEVLYFVGDVGNNLNGGAQIVAAAFFFQNTFVDLTGGEVVGAPHPCGDKALVVAQIEVGFCPIFGHEDFAMLEGRHRARVDVDIGIKLN